MKKKSFDCVTMKREGAREVLNRLDAMTRAEQLQYWRRRTEEILERQKRHAQTLQDNR